LDIFETIQKEVGNPVYYLSTNLAPAHRKEVIKNVDNSLRIGQKVILVSTQSIEAGVDLDFDMGFRDIGPLDSIIQVAGRINRNNREGFKYSPLYIVNFKQDAQRIYGKPIIRITSQLINTGKKYFLENEYLRLIKTYFNLITNQDQISFMDSRTLYRAMKSLRFTKDDDDEENAVEDFQLIDDLKNNYTDVYICLNKEAVEALDTYLNEYLLCKKINEKRNIYLKIKSVFNKYKISAPLQMIKTLYDNSMGIEELIPDKLFSIKPQAIGNYDKKKKILYDHSTGLCRKEIQTETLIL
jgi:CRISPR-associated endonuclease/helicase Cas3